MMRIVVATISAFTCAGVASAQQSCESPAVLNAVQEKIRHYGATHSEWVFRSGLEVPYYRMKDVKIEVVSVENKGPVRTGLDCHLTARLFAPTDLPSPNIVKMGFGYVIIAKPDGGFDLDTY